MENEREEYIPVIGPFRQLLERCQGERKYVKIQYFTELREYLSVSALIKQIVAEAEAEFLVLSSGELVRLDRIVRVDGTPAPGYHIDDFTCDC
jgi:Rho-binding antiterminator